jgi:hypothetical protein
MPVLRLPMLALHWHWLGLALPLTGHAIARIGPGARTDSGKVLGNEMIRGRRQTSA